jgi:hypothetical protein
MPFQHHPSSGGLRRGVQSVYYKAEKHPRRVDRPRVCGLVAQDFAATLTSPKKTRYDQTLHGSHCQKTGTCAVMAWSLTTALRASRQILAGGMVSAQSLLLAFQYSDYFNERKANVYNILWALVFGFATLNILGLVARRMEPRRSGLSFGEILAVAVVAVALVLLAWELLYLFQVLPIKLEPR